MSTTAIPNAAALRARDLARATPTTRDRYVDFLRIASIVVVVLGHWLMAVVVVRDGTFEIGNVLGMVPLLWLATWLLQVMPVFFFVGGFANLVTIDAQRRRGSGAAEYLVSRAQRLVRPVTVLFAVWIPIAVTLTTFGFDRELLGDATRIVCQPLWFVGVYLMVSALAPPMRALHARFSIVTVVMLAGGAALVDVVRFAGGIGSIGWANVLLVWLFAQQLGFFYADGSLTRVSRRALGAVAGVAVVALGLLTTFGPYPKSMVGLPGDRISNMAPPTLCLVVLTVLQVALVMLCRPAITRWLQRERVWTPVVAGNGVIMTIFLWHLSAMLFAVTLLYPLGFPQPDGGTLTWWVTRPLWILSGLVPLVALVALFGRFERPGAATFRAVGRVSVFLAAIGVAVLAIGISGIATGSLGDLVHGTSRLVLFHITPVRAFALAGLGWLVLRASVHRKDRHDRPLSSATLPGA